MPSLHGRHFPPTNPWTIISEHTINAAVGSFGPPWRTVYQSRLIKLAECPVITCERAIHQLGQNS